MKWRIVEIPERSLKNIKWYELQVKKGFRWQTADATMATSEEHAKSLFFKKED